MLITMASVDNTFWHIKQIILNSAKWKHEDQREAGAGCLSV